MAVRRPALPRLHPLASSVRRIDRVVDGPALHLDAGALAADGSWYRCEQVLRDPEFFGNWQRAVAGDLLGTYGEAPQRTLDAYLLHWYLRIPALTGCLLFHLERRVPGLAPRHLAFRLDPSHVSDVAVRAGRFWCLPCDPAAEHPHATAVADLDELAGRLRAQVVAHAARFLRVYGPITRFGRHTLWAAVSDAIDAGMLVAGGIHRRRAESAADAARVLTGEAPLGASTTYLATDTSGAEQWTRRRSSCCFHYALPRADGPCVTCPRVDDQERARMLAQT